MVFYILYTHTWHPETISVTSAALASGACLEFSLEVKREAGALWLNSGNASTAPATVIELSICITPLCVDMGRRRLGIYPTHESGDRPEVNFTTVLRRAISGILTGCYYPTRLVCPILFPSAFVICWICQRAGVHEGIIICKHAAFRQWLCYG